MNADYNPLRELARLGAEQVIRDAADIIDERGWVQGVHASDGRVDIEGALALASKMPVKDLDELNVRWEHFSNLVPQARRPAAFAATQFLDGFLGVAPTEWNDTHGRTVDEVTAALRAAADRLATLR